MQAVAALRAGDGGAAVRALAREETPGVFSFEMFRPEFCEVPGPEAGPARLALRGAPAAVD